MTLIHDPKSELSYSFNPTDCSYCRNYPCKCWVGPCSGCNAEKTLRAMKRLFNTETRDSGHFDLVVMTTYECISCGETEFDMQYLYDLARTDDAKSDDQL